MPVPGLQGLLNTVKVWGKQSWLLQFVCIVKRYSS